MAYINIPDDLLTGSELKTFEDAVKAAVKEKKNTGSMILSRFMKIIKDACRRIWDKISGFIEDVWEGLKVLFA